MKILNQLQVNSSDYSDQKLLKNTIKRQENCFVGWIDSYNSSNNTVNVQPAIQEKIINSNNEMEYRNRPFIINAYVIINTLTRNPQKGDKCLLFVLDEKSNNFFKAIYDSSLTLQEQTIVNTSMSYKTLSNCVAIIINGNHI